MTTTALGTKQTGAESLEQVLLTGDLAALSPTDRILYYNRTCESLGLNSLTKPFEYIKLNGKLTLYARKDATDQLRKIHGISIEKPDIQQIDNLIIVTVSARDNHGRIDSDIGVVAKTDMQGNLGNALMKAVTKAKRRVTLSICGLGLLDETEVETIPNAQIVPVDIPQADPHETWTDEQLEEFETVCEKLSIYTDFIGYSPTVVMKMNAKIDSFATIGECWDALEKVAVEYYEKLSAKITEGLAAQNWDAEEIESYLAQFDVTALIEATRDQLEIVYADMKDSKMI